MSDAQTIHKAGAGKQVNKPFKSKHATKNSVKRTNKGRVIKGASLKHNAVAGQEQLSKQQRRNRLDQIRKQKKENVLHQKRIGQDAAPKIVAMISLSDPSSVQGGKVLNVSDVRSKLVQVYNSDNNSHNNNNTEQSNMNDIENMSPYAPLTIKLDKKRVTLFEVARETRAVLDAGKVADILLFVVDAESGVDTQGEFFISLLRAQGFCSSLVILNDLDKCGKKKNDVKKYWTRWLHEQIPDEPRIIPYDSNNASDVKQLGRWLGEQSVKEIQWREKRPYMVVDKYEFVPNNNNNNNNNSAETTDRKSVV